MNDKSGNWWSSFEQPKPRPRWGRRVFVSVLLSLIILLFILFHDFVPNPLVFTRYPSSDISSEAKAGDWPGVGRDTGHSRYAPEGPTLTGRIRWTVDLTESTDSAPAVVDGILYVGGFFKVHALEASTGRKIWETGVSGPIQSSPALAGGLLFFGLLDGRVIALERHSGKLKWEFQSKNFVFSSPVIVDGILYIGSGDETVYALDATNGRLIWKKGIKGRVQAPPIVKDNILYVLSDRRNIYSLSARTGALRLHYRLFRDATDSAVLANDLVYFVSRDGYLYTIRHRAREIPGQYQIQWLWMQLWIWGIPVPRPRPQAGSEWRAEPKYRWRGFQFSPAVTPEAMYVGDRVGFFYALSASDGSPMWNSWAGKGNAVSASPVVIGETVYFPTAQGRLYALNRQDGKFLWELQLESPIKVGPVYADGLLFLRTEDGKLYAVE